MAESDINVVLDSPANYQFELAQDSPLNFEFLPDASFAVSVAEPPPIQVVFVAQQPLINVNIGVVGIQGPPGPTGPRGSLFLGGYPSFSNLPIPDGVNIKVGDFALVQDESAIYELE